MTDPIVKEEPVIETPTPETPVVTPPVPGSQTDPALLLIALKEEREKRRLAEEALLQAKQTPPETGEVFSDEGKIIMAEVSSLKGIIASKEEKEVMTDLETKHPALKDKATEFNDFRNNPENKGMPLSTAAKAFLIENDLLDITPPRKGVERPQGGGRAPISNTMTSQEVTELRTTNYRKYSQLVREGKIQP